MTIINYSITSLFSQRNESIFKTLSFLILCTFSISVYASPATAHSEIGTLSNEGSSKLNEDNFTSPSDAFVDFQQAQTLSFNKSDIDFIGEQGTTLQEQTITLSASTGNPSITLSDDPDSSGWLILPTNPTLGQLTFRVRNNLPVGTYNTTVFAIAQNGTYSNAQVSISAEIRANTATPVITVSVDELIFETVTNNQAPQTDTKQVTLTNTGSRVLTVQNATFSGPFASQFSPLNGVINQQIAAGASYTFAVTYAPDLGGSNLGYQNAQLTIATNASNTTSNSIGLYALKKSGLEGNSEPPLQDVVNTLGIGINVGWTVLSNGVSTDLMGEEVLVQKWRKLSNNTLRITPVGRYSPAESLPFGWYNSVQGEVSLNQIGILADGLQNAQRLNPPLSSGSETFDPGSEEFGIYLYSNSFDRFNYTEDYLNTDNVERRARTYPLKDRQGNLIANSYLVTFEDATNGDYQDYMFVIENVTPVALTPVLSLNTTQFVGDAVTAGNATDTQDLILTNTGNGILNNIASQITGGAAGQFTASGLPQSLNPGASATFTISFNPSANGPQNATFSLSGANATSISIPLKGLGKRGTGGTNEPSLQWILDTQLGNGTINVGDTDITTNLIDLPAGANYNSLLGDEIDAQAFTRANEQPVRVEVLSVFGPEDNNPVVAFGWYPSGNNSSRTELATVTNTSGNGQTLNPTVTGNLEFSPNAQSFGFYSRWPFFDNRILKSEDALNNFSGAIPHHVRVYKLPGEESAYIIATEENVSGYDYQDVVLLVRNIEPVEATNEGQKINFSDAATAPPAGYLRDSGAAFGSRGNGNRYGWLSASNSTPVNVSGNARNRNVAGVDVKQNTLIHMQYGSIPTNSTAEYLPDAIWEMEIANGTYQVTVGVGDANVDPQATERPSHVINAEGTRVIDNFVPTGVRGSSTRFFTATKIIVVEDGRLTLTPTGGFNTKINYVEVTPTAQELPYFTNVNPDNNATGVAIRDFQINVSIFVPNGYELDKNTTAGNVQLFEITRSGEEILLPTNSNDTGGGDAITLTPRNQLKEFTSYIFRVNNIEANSISNFDDRLTFIPFESTFTTGALENIPTPSRDLSGIEFTKVLGGEGLGDGTVNQLFSSLVIGPDGKLYASTLGNFQSDGTIQRWDILPDGTLANLEVLTPQLQGAPHPVSGARSNNNRIIIGLVFDPVSTADNLIVYITHSAASVDSGSGELGNGPEWDGVITRLSGPSLSNVQDVVVHLPRSLKDHLTNSLVFDEDGFMYVSQGSNSAGGSPDPIWGQRRERLLSGAVLKLDFSKMPTSLPLDAYTTDDISVINNAPQNNIRMSNGTYNPYATNSPLTIFATGIRNAYDLLWHSNGWLYIPTNGTAGNGTNSPITPSTESFPLARRIDGRTSVTPAPQIRGGETQKDWLFKSRGGSYHGHPNPYRGEFVLNHGGLPYSGLPGQSESSYVDVSKYARSLGPDINYMEPAYDFGFNKSPNGVIEYKSDAFGGRLKGLVMVVRFSGQDDLFVMEPASNGDISEVYFDIPGLSGFDDPLDVVEDLNTGNMYVSEYDRDQDGVARLTLLRASQPAVNGPSITSNESELLFETVTNNQGANTQTKEVTLSNTGQTNLVISNISLSGNFAAQFNGLQPTGEQIIAPGQELVLSVTYAPALNNQNLGYQDANILIESNSVENPAFSIGLYGLKKGGLEGDFEPTLQNVVNTLGLGVDVGWNTLTTSTDSTLQGEEIQFDQWIQATDAPVTITPVARYSPAELLPFGWYTTTGGLNQNEVGVLDNGLENAQRLYPPLASGTTSFNPNGAIFGIYVYSQVFERFNYTQDSLNSDGVSHRVRSYPIKNRQGDVVEDSYLITFEDSTNGDYQDYMFIISNAIPVNSGELALNFNPESLDFAILPDSESPKPKTITLTANGLLTAESVQLTASQPWVILPEEITLGDPMEIGVNTEELVPGEYTATVVADAENYAPATLMINISVVTSVNYTYQFNFQDINDKLASPLGYTDDFGISFNGQPSALGGDLSYGWVLPGTSTPADAEINGRNRNTGTQDNPLRGTFSLVGHRDPSIYPLRDWLINIPNGSYVVNLSVGDADFSDSNHVLDVNGVTVLSFDEQGNNPNNLIYFEDSAEVSVTDGTLRLSLGEGGVNAKVNYIRIAPLGAPQTPPQITATFDGVENQPNEYRGAVAVTLTAEALNNGSVSSLTYSLDGGAFTPYTGEISVATSGAHTLLVNAIDSNGVSVQNNYYFTIAQANGALIYVENMTKIPGTNEGFPADDYYTFYRLANPGQAITHDSNVLRINNTGTGALTVSNIIISNTRNYSYEILGDSAEATLPLTIAPGGFRDVNLRIIGSTANGTNRIFKETIRILSNADNSSESISTLHGGYAPQPESGANGISDEIDAQQVFNAFGFTTSMLSIVNDQGTITPPNRSTTRPSSNAPLAENVDAGYEGDMILPQSFVQADPAQPVRIIQLSAFHGFTPGNAKFVSATGTGVVGGINTTHTRPYYQTLLPKNASGGINSAVATSITVPFRIAIENYLNTGGNDIRGTNPSVLGLRVYKVVDRDGNVVPNEYIALQDYVLNGCGAGSANCDWNDNTYYIKNVRPSAVPSVSEIAPYYAYVTENFSYSIKDSFLKGYPGNKLTFESVPSSGTTMPEWLRFNPANGTFSGTPPEDALDSYSFTITATDLNGLQATGEFTLLTLRRGDTNDFSLRINAGGPTVTFDGREFVEDRYFSESISFINNRADIPQLFKSERSGPPATFGYSIPVPNDYSYEVTLHFTEIYWGAPSGGPGGVGKRVFDVSLEDSLILDNYDITADVGVLNPTAKTYQVSITDGVINIDFSSLARAGGIDLPMVSAIEITPLDRINNAPVAIATATPRAGAVPLLVDFVGSNSTDDIGIASYSWTLNGEVISTTADFQYTFEEVGIYDVNLTVLDDEGLSSTASVTITVAEPGVNIAPTAIATADPIEGSVPLIVAFTGSNSTDDVGVVSYSWTIDGVLVSNAADFEQNFDRAGNYMVTLTVADQDGLTDTESLVITVRSENGNAAPMAIATANVLAGTPPLAVLFTGSSSTDDTGIESYSWTLDGAEISDAADFEYTFEEAGTYTITLTVTDGEGLTNSASLTITAGEGAGNQPPVAIATASITSGPAPLAVSFMGSASTDDVGIESYSWSVDGTVVSANADFNFTFTEAGMYTVELTVTDAEGLSDTATLSITVEGGPFSIIVYPNPATTKVTVRLENAPAKINSIAIYDARGRTIHTFNPPQDQEETIYEMPLPILAAGMYILAIDDVEGNTYIERLIIKNY